MEEYDKWLIDEVNQKIISRQIQQEYIEKEEP